MADYYDTFHSAYARNLSRIVNGTTLDVEPVAGYTPDGPITNERTVEIASIRNVIVGVDSTGLFVGVTVLDTEGGEWTLYGDGTITDSDDRQVGRHTLKTMPEPTKPAGVL